MNQYKFTYFENNKGHTRTWRKVGSKSTRITGGSFCMLWSGRLRGSVHGSKKVLKSS